MVNRKRERDSRRKAGDRLQARAKRLAGDIEALSRRYAAAEGATTIDDPDPAHPGRTVPLRDAPGLPLISQRLAALAGHLRENACLLDLPTPKAGPKPAAAILAAINRKTAGRPQHREVADAINEAAGNLRADEENVRRAAERHPLTRVLKCQVQLTRTPEPPAPPSARTKSPQK